MKFKSFFELGERVALAVGFKQKAKHGIVAMVTGVTFREGKVTYELDVGRGKILRNVDSVFIHKLH